MSASLQKFDRSTIFHLSDKVSIVLGDCLQFDLSVFDIDAVISDPPYGMNWDNDSTRYARRKGEAKGRSNWGKLIGDDQPFDPSPWLDFKKAILFGSNHYAQRLPVGTTLVWIKKHPHLFGTFLSDAEIAWMKGNYGIYLYYEPFTNSTRRVQGGGDPLHPNQKPIGLMAWCMEMAKVPKDGLVLDPYMGSGTTGIAAIQTGRRFLGIEIDEKRFEIAAKRLEHELKQLRLFA